MPKKDRLDFHEHKLTVEDLKHDTVLYATSILKEKLGDRYSSDTGELAEELATRSEGQFIWLNLKQLKK